MTNQTYKGHCKHCGKIETITINGPLVSKKGLEKLESLGELPDGLERLEGMITATGECGGTKSYQRSEIPIKLNI